MLEPNERRAARFHPLAAILAAVLLAPAVESSAQAPLSRTFNPIESHAAKTLLRRASEQAAQGQWSEALDLYQKVIAQHANTMAEVPKDDPLADPVGTFRLLVDARQQAQARIAALPPEARALYRSRVDAQAERLFRQGVADRDRVALHAVIDGLFASSWGDDALEALGDLAFQEGQFGEALADYRRLVPDPRAGSAGLAYPDPDVPLARVAAKALLARAAMGTDPPLAADLRAFSAAYPEAKGMLAGRDGPLSESLAAALADDHLAAPLQSDGRWPTFAGAASRSRIAPGPIDVGQLQWQVKLVTPPAAKPVAELRRNGMNFGMSERGGPAAASPDAQLAHHPIILGDEVVISDEGGMHAFHLNARQGGANAGEAGDVADKNKDQAGETLVAWNQPIRGSSFVPPPPRPGAGTPRFTLTASGDRIFGRLGGSGRSGSSVLVAVRNNRDVEGKRLWDKSANEIPLPRARPDAPYRYTATFEGSPVADGRSVYIAMSEGSATETDVHVACLDAETGAVRWVKSLGTARSNDNGNPNGMNNGFNGGGSPATEIGNRLLSLDGQTVYYQTNLGAVAALDAETGSVRWLATYPIRDRASAAPAREANPAVVHDGLVMIAADDALPIYAFDAVTGRLVWKTAPMDRVTHLLGVARGHLVATGDRVYRFALKDGSLKSAWPDGASGFEACGRGVLAGDSIYWPTKTDIHVLDQETGAPGDREPIRLMQHHGVGGGNLAVGDGYLIIAQKDSLVVFAQNSRLIDRIREEIAKAPDRALPYFELARVAEATGQIELALTNLEEARKRARPTDTVDGQPLADEARAKQYRLLVRLAHKAKETGDWNGQVARLVVAVDVARNDRDRLAARLGLAEAQTKAGNPQAAVVTLQDVLADESLRSRTVPGDSDEHWTVRADLLIADQLESMLKSHGRALYAPYDAKAEAMLTAAKKAKSARALGEVARAYPAAKVAAESLLALGMLQEEEKRPAEAARAYKRLATMPAGDALRAKALLGLAHAYEAQGLVLSARETLSRAQARYADLRLDDLPRGPGTVGSFVAERLSRPPFDKVGGDRAETIFTLPLARTWERTWKTPVRPIAADGVPPSPASGRVLLAEKTAIRPVDPSDGSSPWTFELGEEPIWAGYLADRLIVATATKLVALDPARGEVRWRYPAEAALAKKAVTNPFAPAPGATRPEEAQVVPGPLHDFRVVGNRVYCQRGDRELLAIDGDAGGVEWTFAPSGGGINPNLLVGPRRVVLQIQGAGPPAMIVLDSETGRGRELARPPLVAGEEPAKPWERSPLPIDEDHVCVALDPNNVALVNLATGARVWTSQAATPALPRSKPPRLLGDAIRLLAVYEGNELIRLDPVTGRRLWSRSLGLGDSPAALALDGDRVFCATGATLAAYALSDGQPAWSRPLSGPRSGWSVALTDRYVAAYPDPGRGDDSAIEGLPLVVCRRDDGAIVQRLAFRATVTNLAVSLLPQGAIVATQGGAWALKSAER